MIVTASSDASDKLTDEPCPISAVAMSSSRIAGNAPSLGAHRVDLEQHAQ